MYNIIVQATVEAIVTLSEDSVNLECKPYISCQDVYRIWTYTTAGGSGNLTTLEDVDQSRFQSQSPSLHQLILPNVTVSDEGNYTCVVRSFDNAVIFNHTISLTVIPGTSLYGTKLDCKTNLYSCLQK